MERSPRARPTERRALRAIVAGILVVLATLGFAAPATAEGSVPSEVTAFVRDGSLVDQLRDVYGPDGSGGGIDFDEATTDTGPIERIHAWSPDFLAGVSREDPVILLNEWAVPVTLDEEPVGVAIVWINPDSVLPELASFDPDVPLAVGLADLPDGAALVRDSANAAWLTVDAAGLVTPIVAGSTGLASPVPIDDIAIVAPEPVVAPAPSSGTSVALAVAAALLAAVVLALLVPRLRRRAEADEPHHHHGIGHPAEHRADAEHPAVDGTDATREGDTRPIPVVAPVDDASVEVADEVEDAEDAESEGSDDEVEAVDEPSGDAASGDAEEADVDEADAVESAEDADEDSDADDTHDEDSDEDEPSA